MKGESTEVAIKQTIEENGGVIITLGLLLFVTFISLSFTGIRILRESVCHKSCLQDQFADPDCFYKSISVHVKRNKRRLKVTE